MLFILWGYTNYQLMGLTMAIASLEEQCDVPTKSLEKLYASQSSHQALCVIRKPSAMERKAPFVTCWRNLKHREKITLQRGKGPSQLPKETP